jgi:hypothetical protein
VPRSARRPFFAPPALSDSRQAPRRKTQQAEGHPLPLPPPTSIKNVNDDPAVQPNRSRLGDGSNSVGHPPPFADDPPEIVLGNADLVDQIAVLFQLLDFHGVGILDQRPDEELE